MSGSESKDPPLLADPQDPLPESNWLFRRIYIFVTEAVRIVGLAVILTMLYIIAQRVIGHARAENFAEIAMKSVEALYNLGFWLVMLSMVDRALYLIAPSAEQAAKMMMTLSAWKEGISTSVSSKVSSPAGSAETKTVTGPAKPAAVADPNLPDYAR